MGYLCEADNAAKGQAPNGRAQQNPKKINPNGPAPKPTPTQTTPPNQTQPPPHLDDWFCSFPNCQRDQLASSKSCLNCHKPRPKTVQSDSPLTKKLGPTKNDQKLIKEIVEAPEAEDGEGEKKKTQEEEDDNYLAQLKKIQEMALVIPHPKTNMQKEIEGRAAEITQLEAKAATRGTKKISELATSETSHEEKYQKEMKILREKLGKAEEAVKMTISNKKLRLEENVQRMKAQEEKINTSFDKFHTDEEEKRVKIEEEMKKGEEIHKETMKTIKEARIKAGGGDATAGLEEGQHLIAVPVGMPLLGPVQISHGIVKDRLEALAQQGGIMQGISPELIQLFATVMSGLMEQNAVTPAPFKPDGTAAAAPSSSSTTETRSNGAAAAVPVHKPSKPEEPLGQLKGKRGADNSEEETGTGEAFQKQHKDEGTVGEAQAVDNQ